MTTNEPRYTLLAQTEANHRKIEGTCRLGMVYDLGADDIAQALGNGCWSQSEKNTLEWWIEFEDGKIATIYDYAGKVSQDTIRIWHIGGKDSVVRERIEALLGQEVMP